MGWGCRHKRLFVPRKDWRRNPGSGARRPGHIGMPVISLHHCIERIGSEGRATCVEACHQRQPPLCNPTIDHCRQFQSAQGTRAFKHVACTPICWKQAEKRCHSYHPHKLSTPKMKGLKGVCWCEAKKVEYALIIPPECNSRHCKKQSQSNNSFKTLKSPLLPWILLPLE